MSNVSNQKILCQSCKNEILEPEKEIKDNDNYYHLKCLKCVKCREPRDILDKEKVKFLNGNIYCKVHFLSLKYSGQYFQDTAISQVAVPYYKAKNCQILKNSLTDLVPKISLYFPLSEEQAKLFVKQGGIKKIKSELKALLGEDMDLFIDNFEVGSFFITIGIILKKCGQRIKDFFTGKKEEKIKTAKKAMELIENKKISCLEGMTPNSVTFVNQKSIENPDKVIIDFLKSKVDAKKNESNVKSNTKDDNRNNNINRNNNNNNNNNDNRNNNINRNNNNNNNNNENRNNNNINRNNNNNNNNNNENRNNNNINRNNNNSNNNNENRNNNNNRNNNTNRNNDYKNNNNDNNSNIINDNTSDIQSILSDSTIDSIHNLKITEEDEELLFNEMEKILQENEKSLLEEIEIIDKTSEINEEFKKELDIALKNGIFEFYTTGIIIVNKDEQFDIYQSKKSKCSNCQTKILFHGTKIESSSKILQTNFKIGTDCWFGLGIYFTDQIDYARYYWNGWNCLYEIPNIGESFSLVVSEVYYDKSKFKQIYDRSLKVNLRKK